MRISGGVLVAALCLTGAARAQSGVERFRLDNGLTVILRPAAASKHVACVVLFDVGEAHDPPGKSGLSHLVEHLYVTAAAGSTPDSTAMAWMGRYHGSNAQTGRAYTVIATVFARERLEPEIAEAAARMSDLRLEQADLEREWPRMEIELGNMYGGMPYLAAMNLALGAVAPLPAGARKGGVFEQIRAISLDEARQWHRRHYQPVNATIALAGGFDAAAARERITAAFGALPPGERLPALTPAPETRLGATQRLVVPRSASGGPAAIAAISYKAPRVGSDLYPAFLILTARAFSEAMPRLQAARQSGSPVSPLWYAPFDAPEAITFSIEVAEGQSDEDAIAMIRTLVAQGTTFAEDEPAGLLPVKTFFGQMLGLAGVPEPTIVDNEYFVAFSLGRRQQLGLDPAALEAALKKVTRDDLRRCAQEVFAPQRSAAVVVRTEPAAKPPTSP